jgi:hypothetical protein
MAVLATIDQAARAGAAGWTRLGLAVGVSSAAALIGCTAVAFFGEEEDAGPAFSHRIHVIDQGFDCTICHETQEGNVLPTPPAIDQCMLCHASLDLDEEKPLSRQAVGFYVRPRDEAGAVLPEADLVLRPGLPPLSSEVVFDHAVHSAALDGNCLACHVGMDQSERIVPGDALTMTDCVDCHAESGRQDSCSVCHSVIDTNWSPPGHELDWLRHHGEASRDPHPPIAADCAMCHSQASCTACHQSMPPENHDEFFRLRGHGVHADLSRESCLTCHRSDSCVRCHESTRPTSHHGGFGSPANMHCNGCHFPLAGEGCATCHGSAPSHALAAPQPPDHVPGANCRLCHGAGAPLPHPDDGSNCAACHR